MWWFALILFLNLVLPTRMLYEQLGMHIAGFRATPLDVLLFAGPLVALLAGWRRNSMAVHRMHPAFTAAIVLVALAFAAAAVAGTMHWSSQWHPRWYFAPLRNLLILPVAAYMGYRVLRYPYQCKTVVWVIFASSLASAVGMVLTSGQAAAEMAAAARATFDALRDTQAQASGETGLLAACLLVFCFVARVRFLPLPIAVLCLGVSGLGMFFVVHRSSWLMCAMVLMFAGLYLWPIQRVRAMLINGALAMSVILAAVIAIAVVQRTTERDFSSWVIQRVESLLPGDDYKAGGRAWDTRLPGLKFDLDIWMQHPVLGGGFGVHESHALRTGNYVSMRHTPWTSTLAESGPLGLAAFSVVIGALLIVGTRLARSGPDIWMMLTGVLGACLGFSAFILGWFTLSWNTPRQALTLGLVFGIVMRCRDMALAIQAEQLPLAGDQWDASSLEARSGL